VSFGKRLAAKVIVFGAIAAVLMIAAGLFLLFGFWPLALILGGGGLLWWILKR
jgi:hypothetical protein